MRERAKVVSLGPRRCGTWASGTRRAALAESARGCRSAIPWSRMPSGSLTQPLWASHALCRGRRKMCVPSRGAVSHLRRQTSSTRPASPPCKARSPSQWPRRRRIHPRRRELPRGRSLQTFRELLRVPYQAVSGRVARHCGFTDGTPQRPACLPDRRCLCRPHAVRTRRRSGYRSENGVNWICPGSLILHGIWNDWENLFEFGRCVCFFVGTGGLFFDHPKFCMSVAEAAQPPRALNQEAKPQDGTNSPSSVFDVLGSSAAKRSLSPAVRQPAPLPASRHRRVSSEPFVACLQDLKLEVGLGAQSPPLGPSPLSPQERHAFAGSVRRKLALASSAGLLEHARDWHSDRQAAEAVKARSETRGLSQLSQVLPAPQPAPLHRLRAADGGTAKEHLSDWREAARVAAAVSARRAGRRPSRLAVISSVR